MWWLLQGGVEGVHQLVGQLGDEAHRIRDEHRAGVGQVQGAGGGVQRVEQAVVDIFAKRARTSEGRLQVALAQYKYLLPRLTGMWKHLERQEGDSSQAVSSWERAGEFRPARTARLISFSSVFSNI